MKFLKDFKDLGIAVKTASVMAFGLAAALGYMQADAATEQRSPLIGAWQEGAAEQAGKSVPSPQKKAPSGNIMVFNANHIFLLYPECGKEAAAYKAKNVVSVQGTWALPSEDSLHLTVEYGGKKVEQTIPIGVAGDSLTFDKGSSKASVFGRYHGNLPPVCSGK